MQRLLTNSHELQDFNHFYRIFMGYGLPIKSYKLFKNRVHLTKAANVLMKYRLCDIMAWALCNDKSGPVPLHKRRVFKVLQRTVSFLPYSKSINTYYSFKTFHSMRSVKAVLNNTRRHFVAAGPSEESMDIHDDLHDDQLSGCLNKLWKKYHMFSESASKAIIGQTVALAAYHICCLLEVDICSPRAFNSSCNHFSRVMGI